MEEWIVIVDDNTLNLQTAKYIFNEAQMRARFFKSGADMLKYLDGTRIPDLILLDIHMPEMDGFEVLRRLREQPAYENVPVIFLTADDDVATERKCVDMGAADIIKKPFAAEVLLLRVRKTIAFNRSEKLSRAYLETVRSLTVAMYAKDTYISGHSFRVAEYAKMIAERAGYIKDMQEQVYLTGLLHDVGMIGVPESIINKQDKLTEEEFAIIRSHTVSGEQILHAVSELPELGIVAHRHHERYDGSGYPDGLQGEDIPEIARIISVADSYDAMTSRRSYRDVLPRQTVREELEHGKGTQFDPGFADIMLQIMEEDTEYQMKEK